MSAPTKKPAPRHRTKRPVLTVIRSRNLPDESPVTETPKVSRAWAMYCITCIVWPVPGKPGDKLVFNEHGIRRHRQDGPLLKRDRTFPPLLTNAELDRVKLMGSKGEGALSYSSASSVSLLSQFRLWLTARDMGFDIDRLRTPPRAS